MGRSSFPAARAGWSFSWLGSCAAVGLQEALQPPVSVSSATADQAWHRRARRTRQAARAILAVERARRALERHHGGGMAVAGNVGQKKCKWRCPCAKCAFDNFGFREKCLKCGMARPKCKSPATQSKGSVWDKGPPRGLGVGSKPQPAPAAVSTGVSKLRAFAESVKDNQVLHKAALAELDKALEAEKAKPKPLSAALAKAKENLRKVQELQLEEGSLLLAAAQQEVEAAERAASESRPPLAALASAKGRLDNARKAAEEADEHLEETKRAVEEATRQRREAWGEVTAMEAEVRAAQEACAPPDQGAYFNTMVDVVQKLWSVFANAESAFQNGNGQAFFESARSTFALAAHVPALHVSSVTQMPGEGDGAGAATAAEPAATAATGASDPSPGGPGTASAPVVAASSGAGAAVAGAAAGVAAVPVPPGVTGAVDGATLGAPGAGGVVPRV